jgi:hypothetical protein
MGLTLYEINQQLMDAVEYSVDPETGELLDGKELEDKINEIKLSLDDKISNIACFIKSLEAEKCRQGREDEVSKETENFGE